MVGLCLKCHSFQPPWLSTGKHKTLDVTAKLETIKACLEINDSKSVTGRRHNLKSQSTKTDQYFNTSLQPPYLFKVET
jgi:hypothetical protein